MIKKILGFIGLNRLWFIGGAVILALLGAGLLVKKIYDAGGDGTLIDVISSEQKADGETKVKQKEIGKKQERHENELEKDKTVYPLAHPIERRELKRSRENRRD